MSAARNRRGRGGGGGEQHADERWLLTYADMITLLMALFMVLFSISSVNVSKFESLQESLQAAFSGKVTSANDVVLTGGESVFAGAGAQVQGIQTAEPSLSADQSFEVMPKDVARPSEAAAAAEEQNLRELQRRAEEYAREHGLSDTIRTALEERGLVIRLLTDKVMFASGSGALAPGADHVVADVAQLIDGAGVENPIRVEGNTDSQPISTSTYPSNWELSTARATAVLQSLLHHGLPARRLSVAGYADQHPIAPNTSAAGRSANRRVDVVVLRMNQLPGGSSE